MLKISSIVSQIDSFVWGPVMLVLLVGTGVLLTVRCNFLTWRNLPWALKKTLSKEERIKNLKGVFKVNDSDYINNKNIILIDDVMTTGATISECKYILKKSGAKQIIVLTIAKSNI